MTTLFVSGPTGCIGAATVAYLLDHGVDRVVGFSRRRDLGRIDPQYHGRLDFIEGDITDAGQVADAMAQARPSRIIHLAAFQTPDCLANPLGGMEVTSEGFGQMTRLFLDVAERSCEGRVISLLEGGYDLEGLAASVESHTAALLG